MNTITLNSGPVCWHDRATKTIGPTTHQINWYCPDCGYTRTTYPDTPLASREEAPTAPSAEAGWKLVPLEPTEEMHAAAVRTAIRCSGNDDFPPRVYRAMLAAAPQPIPSKGESAGVRVGSELLQGVDALLREAYAHWDADQEFKVGKILLALIGFNKGYDKRSDAWCAALKGVQPVERGEG